MGPRKNLEYRLRRAVSRFARATRDNRDAEGPGVTFKFWEGVVAPEETGVPMKGARLDSIPVEVCLNSNVEERVSFACMGLEARKAGTTITNAHIRPWAILVVVARETFYLNRRSSYCKHTVVI